MKKIYFTIILLLISFFNFAQLPKYLPETESNWERIYIKDVGSFDIPPTMEIQAGKYKEFVNTIKGISGYDVSNITVQQKGLNELKFGKYARIMFNTDYGNYNDYELLNFDINNYSQNDILEINKIYKNQIIQGFKGTGLKLIKWYSLKFEIINGMSCIHVKYIRQLNSKPNVLVNMYMFHNNDRVHNLTLSYRLNEETYWKDNFKNILNSFRITNIR